jgi:predicted RecB family nuclease
MLIIERGKEHERECVATLKRLAEPDWDGKDLKIGFESTLALMKEGHPWIYQGVLRTDVGVGVPDLLERVQGTSRLGKHTYMPIDVKCHKEVNIKDRYQLSAYAALLEPVLGYRPDAGGIWLNTGQIETVDLTRDAEKFEALLSDMERIRQGALKTKGYRRGECRTCPWIDYCFSLWEENQAVCLLYGVTSDTARRFTEAGFASWKHMAQSQPREIAERLDITQGRALAYHLHAQAWAEGSPQVVSPATFPSGIPIHFYDIETYGGCVYLHGNVRVLNGKTEEQQFLARSPSEEKRAWHDYLNYLAQDDQAVIYCWADYERSFAQRLWDKYGGNTKGWHHLKQNLVDQCRFVKDHFALPVTTYSIKHVAPVFGFNWSADDAGGLNSEAWYKEWLETGDEKILNKLLQYNLDDVLAMEVIDRELKKVAY